MGEDKTNKRTEVKKSDSEVVGGNVPSFLFPLILGLTVATTLTSTFFIYRYSGKVDTFKKSEADYLSKEAHVGLEHVSGLVTKFDLANIQDGKIKPEEVSSMSIKLAADELKKGNYDGAVKYVNKATESLKKGGLPDQDKHPELSEEALIEAISRLQSIERMIKRTKIFSGQQQER